MKTLLVLWCFELPSWNTYPWTCSNLKIGVILSSFLSFISVTEKSCWVSLVNSSQIYPLSSIAIAPTLVKVIIIFHLYPYNVLHWCLCFQSCLHPIFLHHVSPEISHHVKVTMGPFSQTNKHTNKTVVVVSHSL